MKIIVNAFSARLGGGQTYLKNLFAHLPSDGSVEVLVYAPDSLVLPESPALRRVRTAWPTDNPLARTVWEKLVLPQILRREKADVLFCPGGVVATRVPRGCRVVTMFRNMTPFDTALVQRMPWGLQRLRNLILSRVMLRSMSEADLTIFISDHARQVIEAKVRIPNAVTVPHGIGNAFRTHDRALPRPAGVPDGAYLLYVSRFDLYKHHREVVEGYAALPEALRAEHPLVLIGETHLPEAQHVLRRIGELGVSAHVHVLGAIPYDQLPAYYRNAHATLFASSCENCPNILLEALGAGRPVVSSNVMPMPEFGGSGIAYFSPFDPSDIASSLTRLLTDAPHAQRVAEAAAARSGQYDWATTARDTWRHILALGPRRDAARPA